MGLSPAQFWTLTPGEFWIKHRAFYRADNRAKLLVGLNGFILGRWPKKDRPQSPGQVLGWRGVVPLYPEKPWLKPDK
jgi:hypothetical protein